MLLNPFSQGFGVVCHKRNTLEQIAGWFALELFASYWEKGFHGNGEAAIARWQVLGKQCMGEVSIKLFGVLLILCADHYESNPVDAGPLSLFAAGMAGAAVKGGVGMNGALH